MERNGFGARSGVAAVGHGKRPWPTAGIPGGCTPPPAAPRGVMNGVRMNGVCPRDGPVLTLPLLWQWDSRRTYGVAAFVKRRRLCQGQNVQGGAMISVCCVAAVAAPEAGLADPVRLLGMPASVTALRGVPRVYRLNPLSGARCLESEKLAELTPPTVMEAAGQIPAPHTTDVGHFVGDDVTLPNQLQGDPVMEVQPLPRDLAVQFGSLRATAR